MEAYILHVLGNQNKKEKNVTCLVAYIFFISAAWNFTCSISEDFLYLEVLCLLTLSSGHRTGKGQFSYQSQRKAMQKNAQTTIQLHSSHTSKVMFKILQARLQQYVNHELPDVQAEFRKGRQIKDEIASIHWIIKKATEFQKNIYFCFIDYAKAFDYVDHNKLWKIL